MNPEGNSPKISRDLSSPVYGGGVREANGGGHRRSCPLRLAVLGTSPAIAGENYSVNFFGRRMVNHVTTIRRVTITAV